MFCNFQAIFYSISWSTVSGGWCGATPLCCPLDMTDFIVISDILLCEVVMLAKYKIKNKKINMDQNFKEILVLSVCLTYAEQRAITSSKVPINNSIGVSFDYDKISIVFQ